MIHIGTSGWSYDHWENVLYPAGLPAAKRLASYVAAFDSVELNASFYRWPRTTVFAGWHHRLPPGFLMSVKAPRGLTHAKKLYAPEVWADRIGEGWHELGDRRGVLLVQLGPGQARDDARLDYFLSALPWWIRVAVEFRHESWLDDAVFALLERHGAAYCVMSGAGLLGGLALARGQGGDGVIEGALPIGDCSHGSGLSAPEGGSRGVVFALGHRQGDCPHDQGDQEQQHEGDSGHDHPGTVARRPPRRREAWARRALRIL